METILVESNENTAPRDNSSYKYKPQKAQHDSQEFWLHLTKLTTLWNTLNPMLTGHTITHCVGQQLVLFSTSFGKWEVWVSRAICLFYLLTGSQTHNVVKKQKYTAANTMTYVTVCKQEVSLLLFPHSSQEKSHASLRGKLQAPHEGIINTPPASPQQTDSYMQGWVEELREAGREGEWLLLLTLSHSLLPPSLLAPSFIL